MEEIWNSGGMTSASLGKLVAAHDVKLFVSVQPENKYCPDKIAVGPDYTNSLPLNVGAYTGSDY